MLITGASRGIGRAIAEKLAMDGVVLYLHGRDEAALGETRRMVEQRGAVAHVIAADMADPAEVQRMASEVGDDPLDVLVNNAGIAVVKPFGEIGLAEWQRTLDVNVTAPFLLTQKFAPQMRAGSSIVNILSIAAKTGFPGWGAYSMSKFALEGLSQAIREELRPRGVRVINIYPAATATAIWSSVKGEWPTDKMMSPTDVANAVMFALAQPASFWLRISPSQTRLARCSSPYEYAQTSPARLRRGLRWHRAGGLA
jgi:NAD(P)-dependent dehydrogenase (short-subunit alcohol dehydrogenase family)